MRAFVTVIFLAISSVAPASLAFANTAPVLDAAASPLLLAQPEDAPPPTGAVGTPVAGNLVDFAAVPGGLDNVTDDDPGASLGIAVVATDTTNGTWFFSTNAGAMWSQVGGVSTSSALLLAESSRLYFQPNSGFTGASSITFQAWDQTTGSAGEQVSVLVSGGTSAFSAASDDAVITVDGTPPTVTITGGPSGATDDPTPTFSFTTGGDPVSTRCRVDGTAADNVICEDDFTPPLLADGLHTFYVTVIDAAGNSATDSRAFTTNAFPPQTSLLTSEPARTSSTTGHFTFSSVPGTTFECREDLGAWTACSGAAVLVGAVLEGSHATGILVEGFHTFEVRATNAFGVVDQTPASATWFVDLTAPTAVVPIKPSNPSNDSVPLFAFSAEPGATFRCRIDAEPFVSCPSSFVPAPLADGAHTIDVLAIDLVGNAQNVPTSYSWTIDLSPPDTSILMLGASSGPTKSFLLTSNEAGTFECDLDDTGFVACSASFATPPLADGTHTLVVRAVDVAGNVDPTPAEQSWIVDTMGPESSITALSGNPSGLIASFLLSANEAATFECDVDGGGLAACSSPFTTASLSEGEHTLQVLATDLNDNVGATVATYSWLVDPASPDQQVKCEAAIASSSARYSQARTRALAKCHKARITGTIAFSTDCRSETKTAASIEKAADKMKGAIAKACGGDDKTCGGTLAGEVAPAAVGWPTACPDFQDTGCTNAITDCSGVAECLQCLATAAVDQTIGITFEDLPQTDPETDAVLNKCQAAFGVATTKYLVARSKILQKCWSSRFKGGHANVCPDPGDGDAAAAIAAANAKREATLCKACGGSDGTCDGVHDMDPADILGHTPLCPPVVTPSGADCGAVLSNVAAMNACSACIADFDGDCADLGAVPQFVAYPGVCAAEIPSLDSIDVTPVSTSVNAGDSLPFTATGRFSDGSSRDLTQSVLWYSSDERVATVANAVGISGIVTATRTGTTTISAVIYALAGSATLTVN